MVELGQNALSLGIARWRMMAAEESHHSRRRASDFKKARRLHLQFHVGVGTLNRDVLALVQPIDHDAEQEAKKRNEDIDIVQNILVGRHISSHGISLKNILDIVL
ncbi:hypothetical protein [Consotaella aegiceratis]|uniref:hypothetical protein n=1 Tax=Consotaella aegiceratis TaxID=3097961 RepID=UPI002F3FBF36